jgi:hypothetical protein
MTNQNKSKKIIDKGYLHRQGLQGKVQEFVTL